MTDGADTDYVGLRVPPEAPDVMIVNLDLVRALVQPQHTEPDDITSPATWLIQGRAVHDGDRGRLVLFGDLTLTAEHWIIGVTTSAVLEFRGPNAPDPTTWSEEELDSQVRRLGPWASHVMYDSAAAQARALSVQARLARDVFEIDAVTPEPSYLPMGPRSGSED